MVTIRELIALVLAAVVAFAMFLIVSGAPDGFRRGPSSLAELQGYVMSGLWYVGPSVLLVSLVLSPVLFILRRRGLLNVWTTAGLYALYPVAILLMDFSVDSVSSSLTPAVVYLSSGLAAGVAYWAVAVLPSNPTIERDARKSSARPSL